MAVTKQVTQSIAQSVAQPAIGGVGVGDVGCINRLVFAGGGTGVTMGNNFNGILAGTDSKFTIQIAFRPDSLAANSELVAKTGDSTHGVNERQLRIRALSTGFIDVVYYMGTGVGTNNRIVASTNNQLVVGTTYQIEIRYDGSIDTNNGLDRVTILVDDVECTKTLANIGGSLTDIYAGTAEFSVGCTYANSTATSAATGLIYNVTLLDGGGVTRGQWLGTGNQDADWLDRVGSADGTVVGSPAEECIDDGLSPPAIVPSDWILSLGSWDDAGVWDDTETWQDS